jgi:hypothetical protein
MNTISLSPENAWNLALFLGRLTYDAVRAHAANDAEAEDLRDALYATEKALADTGISPR